MNKYLKVFLFLVCCFSLIISFSHFQKTALSKVQWSEWKWFEHEAEDLTVSFRVYSQKESKELLSKDLVSRGYQPIQIDIVNPTSHEYEISPADVSLPSEKPSKMAYKVMKSTIPRSILFKIAGLIFWPANIVGAIDSLNSISAFDDMRSDWKAMSIQPNEKVPPFSTLHRVIFVPEEHLTTSFKIQLKDVKSGEYEIFESNASLTHLADMQNGRVSGEEPLNPPVSPSDAALESKEGQVTTEVETKPETAPVENNDASHASIQLTTQELPSDPSLGAEKALNPV